MRALRALLILVLTVAFSGSVMLARATASSTPDCHTAQHESAQHDGSPEAPTPQCKVCIGCAPAVADPARGVVVPMRILHPDIYFVKAASPVGLKLAPEPTPPRP